MYSKLFLSVENNRPYSQQWLFAYAEAQVLQGNLWLEEAMNSPAWLLREHLNWHKAGSEVVLLALPSRRPRWSSLQHSAFYSLILYLLAAHIITDKLFSISSFNWVTAIRSYASILYHQDLPLRWIMQGRAWTQLLLFSEEWEVNTEIAHIGMQTSDVTTHFGAIQRSVQELHMWVGIY